ncbi:M15 family metallopeptidase [Aliikangiella sp. IMCC44653]
MQLTWQQSIGLEQSHLVDFKLSDKAVVQVNPNIVTDLQKLINAAQKDGIEIAVISSFRSFEQQLKIWNEKWLGHRAVVSRHGRTLHMDALSSIEKYKAISLWSALPGLSRHHWGTDLDIFDLNAIKNGHKVELTPAEFAPNGPCAKLETWLQANLTQFQFFRPYAEYNGGVAQEPWHISHFSSEQIVQNFDHQKCKKALMESTIQNSEFISQQYQHYVNNYFTNISPITA